MKLLLLSLFVGCALGAKLGQLHHGHHEDHGHHEHHAHNEHQERNLIDLQSSFNSAQSYLPPVKEPESNCPPSVVYRSQTRYSTVVVPSIVYKKDVQTVYKTATQNQIIPTTIVRQVVRTQVVPQVKYVTRVVTQTLENIRTNFVTLPAQYSTVFLTNTVASTALTYKTQVTTRIQQVPTTFFRQVTTTQIVPRQVVSTVFRTNIITRSQQLPAVTRAVYTTKYNTKYSTVIIPAQTVRLTEIVTNTNYVQRTVTLPGATRVVTSTAILPVYSTLYSTRVQINTQTNFVTSTQRREVISTVENVKYRTQYNTRYVTVPKEVVQTRVQTQFVPTTVFRTQTIQSVVNLPAETQYRTVYNKVVRTQQIPGVTSTRINTRYVTNTNFVTSTAVNRQINTVTATETVTKECGYNYDAPKTPFHF